MAVVLQKGQKVDLTKTHPGLHTVGVGLGWDVNQGIGANYDLDASAFLLDGSGKVRNDQDFIFYNNPKGANNSVLYSGDNRTGAGHHDDELIHISLQSVPSYIEKVAFSITIHDAQLKGQNFGQISNAYVRVFNENSQEELIRYNLGETFTVETAIVAAELYRHNGEWKFNAIGSGFQGGLEALCRNFGLEVASPSTNSAAPSPSYSQAAAAPFQTQNSGQLNSQSYVQTQNNQQPSQPFSQPASPMNQGNYPHTGNGDVQCPRCQSTNITSGKKGFGIGKAAIGGLILGPVGLLGGFVGSKKMQFTCTSCSYKWSLDQTDFMKLANEQKEKAMTLFKRYKSQDVLDAVVAGCALVSMADGRLDPSERQKMMDFIHQSDELRVFDTNLVIQRFNDFIRKLEFDPIVGKGEAMRAVGKVNDKREIARLVVRYCIAIGFADGHFEPREQQIVSEICHELQLNPNEFLS
ncbi:TerD family protein [Bacillus taeanensis]|uniref:Tellurium resistance protein TerD n=1 Tax=Bacillus taeanensis TaxID=273032 RepID=A0A366XNJ3_9BACI|nr:TerD family protein [Bacillus taeanensis]RBW67692.1 tellurium resistance protein TerD [Bacillus taeanensis]